MRLAGVPFSYTRRAGPAGHFGEFIQGRLGPDGEVALITLPSPLTAVEAEWTPQGPFRLWQTPTRFLSPAAVRSLFGAILGTPPFGRLRLGARLPPGSGAGVSTAALVALADCLGLAEPQLLASLCIRIEGASDPLMLPDPSAALWASRLGIVMQNLPRPPAFDVVGGFLGDPQKTDPDDDLFPDIGDLVPDWHRAAAAGDGIHAAQIATESALRCRDLRGGPELAPMLSIATDNGALGIAIAHTGNAHALLFRPGEGDPGAAAAALRNRGLVGIRRFRTPGAA